VLGEVKREERGCAWRSQEGGKGLCKAKSRGRKRVEAIWSGECIWAVDIRQLTVDSRQLLDSCK
jgi:hypothetical protein